MPAGRKKMYGPFKRRDAQNFRKSAYKGRMRAYNKVVKKKNRNNFRPFVETLSREITSRNVHQHYKYDTTT